MTAREIYVGAFTGIIGNMLYAIIVGIMKRSDGILDFLLSLLTAKIPFWYFLVVIMVACLIVLLMIRHRKKYLSFLKHTEEDYMGIRFQWVWKLNEANGHYRMDDFWPICPQCGNQLRVELYDRINAYHCTNGHFYDFDKLYNIRRDLIHKLQQDYKDYVSLIDFTE